VQSAWILNASVKRNITFAGDSFAEAEGEAEGEADTGGTGAAAAAGAGVGAAALAGCAVDDAQYQRVIDVCQLRHDISTLPAGACSRCGTPARDCACTLVGTRTRICATVCEHAQATARR